MKNILIIDDDEEMCFEISEILKEQGFNVKTTHDGFKGMEMLEKETCDILLLDSKNPGLTGYDILKNIKEKKIAVKVIVITGRPYIANLKRDFTDEEKNEEDVLKTAERVIQKPFIIEDLILAVGQL